MQNATTAPVPPSRLAEVLATARQLIEAADETCHAVRLPCGSRALAFAQEAGLPSQMSYDIPSTARYSGIPEQTLYGEIAAGRLHAVAPRGTTKGKRITVDEMDRWMEESTR